MRSGIAATTDEGGGPRIREGRADHAPELVRTVAAPARRNDSRCPVDRLARVPTGGTDPGFRLPGSDERTAGTGEDGAGVDQAAWEVSTLSPIRTNP